MVPCVTIREQLQKYRESATCDKCHRKIDPLGFTLGNFDAIEGWRDEYGKLILINFCRQTPDRRFVSDTFRVPKTLEESPHGKHIAERSQDDSDKATTVL
jgi:hypothetical protein